MSGADERELAEAASLPSAMASSAPSTAAEPSSAQVAADLDRLQLDLAEVERALERLDDGTYGHCDACGADLGDEQLALDPVARFCPAHSFSS